MALLSCLYFPAFFCHNFLYVFDDNFAAYCFIASCIRPDYWTVLLAFLCVLEAAIDFSIYLKATLGCLNNLEFIKICIVKMCIIKIYIYLSIYIYIYIYIIYIYIYIYISGHGTKRAQI